MNSFERILKLIFVFFCLV